MKKTRKLIAFLLVFSLIFTFMAGQSVLFAADGDEEEDEFEYSLGDIDGEAGVGVGDARMIMRAAMHLITLNEELAGYADVNGDGVVGLDDARFVLRVSVGLEFLVRTGKEGYEGFNAGNTGFGSAQEMMTYFNDNINRIKQRYPAFSILERSDVDIVAVDNGTGVAGIVNAIKGIITNNVQEDDTVTSVEQNENCKGLLSVKNQKYVSALDASDIYGARCSESKGVIKIEIALCDIFMENIPDSPYTKITDAGVEDDKGIVENLKSVLTASDSNIRSYLKNGLITAEFDAETGNVISYSVVYDQVTYAKDVSLNLMFITFSADELTITITESESCTDFSWEEEV